MNNMVKVFVVLCFTAVYVLAAPTTDKEIGENEVLAVFKRSLEDQPEESDNEDQPEESDNEDQPKESDNEDQPEESDNEDQPEESDEHQPEESDNLNESDTVVGQSSPPSYTGRPGSSYHTSSGHTYDLPSGSGWTPKSKPTDG